MKIKQYDWVFLTAILFLGLFISIGARAGDGRKVEAKAMTESHTGYLKKINLRDQSYFLEIDDVQMFFDQSACEARHEEAPGGFCIINKNSKIRTFPISKTVAVTMQTASHEADGSYKSGEKISIEKLKALVEGSDPTLASVSAPEAKFRYRDIIPFTIIVSNGEVQKIDEIYMP